MNLDDLDLYEDDPGPVFSNSDIAQIQQLIDMYQPQNIHDYHLVFDRIWPGISMDVIIDVMERTVRRAKPPIDIPPS